MTNRIIGFKGYVITELDAITWMVQMGSSHAKAMASVANSPTRVAKPIELRHFVANLAADSRRDEEWNARQQWRAGA